jgi:pimeloyl-ACP methyl ester carboxylesterase
MNLQYDSPQNQPMPADDWSPTRVGSRQFAGYRLLRGGNAGFWNLLLLLEQHSHRLSAAWHLPFYRQARALALDQPLVRHPIWRNPAVDLGGLPVLLVGGLATNPEVLRPLRDWLSRIGCRPVLAPTQYGVACGQQGAIAVEEALARHVAETGEQAVIIAHSRGGQFARTVAVRRPELVRGLITLGSPLIRLLGAHPVVLLKVLGLGVVGSLGVPGLFRASCLWGECCRPLREDLSGPFPADVPFLSIFSRQDEVVRWEASLDPAARYQEISSTHRGLVASPAAFQLLARELTALAHQRLTSSASLRRAGRKEDRRSTLP